MPPFDYLNKPNIKAALKRRYGDEVPPRGKKLRYSGPKRLYNSSEDSKQQEFKD
jgi:hypothetical protein